MYAREPQPGEEEEEEITMLPNDIENDLVGGGDDVVRRKSMQQQQQQQPRQSALWRFFGKQVPRSEIVFFFQMTLIYVVVGVSIYQLCQDSGPKHLWVALLSSCLGYSLPNPTLDRSPTTTTR